MKLVALTTLIFLSAFAQAHFIWATVTNDQRSLRIEVAESPGDSIVPLLGRMSGSIKRYGVGAWNDAPDHKSMSTLLTSRKPGGAELLYGVFEDALIHWSAKGCADLASAQSAIGLPCEILVKKGSIGYTATVTKAGHPSPGAEIELYLPNQPAQHLKANADGNIHFQPKSTHGLLAIGARVTDPTPGTYKNQPYKARWDLTSITVRI